MVCVILLDRYQSLCSRDEYYVSFHGTLGQCEAVTAIPADHEIWARRDFAPTALARRVELGGEPGAIYCLDQISDLDLRTGAIIATPFGRTDNTVRVAAPRLLVAVLGLSILGLILILGTPRRDRPVDTDASR